MFLGKTSNRQIPLGQKELRCLKFRFGFLVIKYSLHSTSKSNMHIFFFCSFLPIASPVDREALGSPHGPDNCAFEQNGTDEVWLCLLSVRNISKLNDKRPPSRTKRLRCTKYNGNLPAANRSVSGCQDRGTLQKTEHERDSALNKSQNTMVYISGT